MWRIGSATDDEGHEFRPVKGLPSFDSEAACREAIEKLHADPQWEDVTLRPLEMSFARNAIVGLGERQADFGYFVIWLMFFALAVVIKEHFGLAVAVLSFLFLIWALEMCYRFIQSVRVRNVGKWWAKPRGRRD